MKKLVVLVCLVGIALLFAPGCKKKPKAVGSNGSGSEAGSGSKVAAKKYVCPMPKDKKVYDKPGKCEKCGMKLKEVK